MATTTVFINQEVSKYFCDILTGECFLQNGKLFMKAELESGREYAVELATGKIHSGMHAHTLVLPSNVEINTK